MPESADRFLFEVEGCSADLRVARFVAREGISELFQLEVIVASEDPGLSFADLADKKALLTMRGDVARHLHGRVERLRVGDYGKKLTTYALTVVPAPHRLLHRYDCRIFQEMTAPVIIEKVLQAAGLAAGTDYRLALQGSYEKREYCVQYRESDYAFICRLMEEEGIYFFFDHAEAEHVMVLADKPSAHEPIAGDASVIFRPQLGAMMSGEHVRRLNYTEEIRSGKVTARDYDFKKPKLQLEGQAEGSESTALEIYDHPGDFELPAHAKAMTKARLEERLALKKVAEGESAVTRLLPGAKFTIAEHPREALNREYLVVRVEHHGFEPLMMEGESSDRERYENRFEAIPSDVPFRPPLVTPRPTIKGVQSAFVVGPAGEEIHVDEHGRVKVQFHWDRVGKNDDKSSCWIRVSQLWAGEGWGAMWIPRIGHEVLVDFMDGDPDRPVITGRVYHGTNVPPYALPAEKTKSTIKSNSSPGGGGFNELRFEDKKGSEEIFLHGQKDWTIHILHDKNQEVDHDETRKVGNDRTLDVVHDQKEKVGHDETFEVVNDRTKKVGHDEVETIGNDRSIEVGHDHTETIGNNLTISTAKVKTEDVGEDATETIGKAKNVSVGTNYKVEVTANHDTIVSANQSTDVKLAKSIKVGNALTIEVGSAKITIEKSGDILVEGANVTVKSSGDTKVEATGNVEVKSSAQVKVEASGKVEVKSSGQMDVSASGPVKVKGAQVGIN